MCTLWRVSSYNIYIQIVQKLHFGIINPWVLCSEIKNKQWWVHIQDTFSCRDILREFQAMLHLGLLFSILLCTDC